MVIKKKICGACEKETFIFSHGLCRFCADSVRNSNRTASVNNQRITINQAWRVFSQWIKRRDCPSGSCTCISCGKTDLAKNMDVGHYIPRTQNKDLYFSEQNCNPQCLVCNRQMDGNISSYRIGLIAKIGLDAVELMELRRKALGKLGQAELQNILKHYS